MLGTVTRLDEALSAVPVGEAAFLFVDVVGFTAFTEAHGDVCAAELAWRLRINVEEQLGADAHVIKTLGDAVMVRVGEPGEAAAAALRIAARALPKADDPPVRVGIACGRAVECHGDYFGAAVNLAARIVALAGPGQVLASAAVAAAARACGFHVEELGSASLRNIARPVPLHEIGAAAHV